VRDLPGVAVKVGEEARVAAIERLGRWSSDRGACSLGLRHDAIHLFIRANIVS